MADIVAHCSQSEAQTYVTQTAEISRPGRVISVVLHFDLSKVMPKLDNLTSAEITSPLVQLESMHVAKIRHHYRSS